MKPQQKPQEHTPVLINQTNVYELARIINQHSRLLEGESHALATILLNRGYKK